MNIKQKNPSSIIYNLASNSSGQVVLILVLITVIGLTVGLSLIARTVTDIRISSQIEQSGRAFSAAEAGIESALKGTLETSNGTVTLPNASAAYEVAAVGGGTDPVTFPLTEAGKLQTVWLIDHNADGTINTGGSSYPVGSALSVCFGTVSGTKPAVILSFLYLDGTTYKIAKASFDPDPSARNNNFGTADAGGPTCGSTYSYVKTITPTADLGLGAGVVLYALRIQPVYQATGIAVIPATGISLPLQGKLITSVGQTTTGIVRRIQVTQGYSVLPALLEFALFSEN